MHHSMSFIVKHALEVGLFVHVNILEVEKDPDKMISDKLEDLHVTMDTMDIYLKCLEINNQDRANNGCYAYLLIFNE